MSVCVVGGAQSIGQPREIRPTQPDHHLSRKLLQQSMNSMPHPVNSHCRPLGRVGAFRFTLCRTGQMTSRAGSFPPRDSAPGKIAGRKFCRGWGMSLPPKLSSTPPFSLSFPGHPPPLPTPHFCLSARAFPIFPAKFGFSLSFIAEMASVSISDLVDLDQQSLYGRSRQLLPTQFC